MHERYRQTTDGRSTAYSSFAKTVCRRINVLTMQRQYHPIEWLANDVFHPQTSFLLFVNFVLCIYLKKIPTASRGKFSYLLVKLLLFIIVVVVIRLHRSTTQTPSIGLSFPCRSVCQLSQQWALQNGLTDRDAVLVEDLGGSEEPCIRWGPDPLWEGAILRGKGWPIVKYRDTLRWAVQKRLNQSRCRLGCGLW